MSKTPQAREWDRAMRCIRLYGRMGYKEPFAWTKKPVVFDQLKYMLPRLSYEAEIRCGVFRREGRILSSIYGEKPLPKRLRRKRCPRW